MEAVAVPVAVVYLPLDVRCLNPNLFLDQGQPDVGC